jgi:hypothetical protein
MEQPRPATTGLAVDQQLCAFLQQLGLAVDPLEGLLLLFIH